MSPRQSQQSTSPFQNRIFLVLGAVILGAFLIRLWGCHYGLPYIYHTDEVFEVKRALKLGALQFDFQRVFKGGLYLILFAEYFVYYIVLYLLGIIKNGFDFLVLYFKDPTGFWLIGRITVVIIGTLNVYCIYRLGEKIGTRTIGLLSALFLAFAYDHTWSSRFITVDILMTTMITISLSHMIDILKSGSQRHYILAALFAAFAVMTKLPAILLLLSFGLTHALRLYTEKKPAQRFLSDRRILSAAVVFVVVTAIGNPGFFPGIIRLALAYLKTAPPEALSALDVDPFPIRTTNIWLYYIKTMGHSLGYPILGFSLVGLAVSLFRRKQGEFILFLFALFSYIMICIPLQVNNIYARYTLPVQIGLVIFAALGIEYFRKFIKERSASEIFLVAAVALTIASPLYKSVQCANLQTHEDTRTIARKWVHANIPAGAAILLEGRGYSSSTTTIPLDNLTSNITDSIDNYRTVDQRWNTNENYAREKDRFHKAAVEALKGEKSYNLFSTMSAAGSYESLNWYIEQGVEYIVINPNKLRDFTIGANYQRYPEIGDFYRDIIESPRLEMIRRFEPVNRLGPTLEIYHVMK